MDARKPLPARASYSVIQARADPEPESRQGPPSVRSGLFSHGLLDKAWEEIEKAVAINPANTLARFRFGVINVYRAKYEEALAVFKTIPREANPALVDRNMATVLFQLGRTQEASRRWLKNT